MERLVGYERAIIVDSITTGLQTPGTVSRFQLEDLPEQTVSHMRSAHDASLQIALQVGHSMGVSLPERIEIVGIEAINVYDFSEELTPVVSSAIEPTVQIVLKILEEWR